MQKLLSVHDPSISDYPFIMTGLKSEKGIGLIELVIAASIAFGSLYFIHKGILSALRAERGVASNLDLSQINQSIRLMTDLEEACAKTTLLGTDLSPLLQTPSHPVDVEVGFTSGPLQVSGPLFGPDHIVGTRKISGLVISNLELVSGSTYFAKMNLVTELTGSALTSRDPKQNYLLQVELDSNNKISKCRGVNGSTSIALSCRMVSSFANEPNGNARSDCAGDETMTSCTTTEMNSGQLQCFNHAITGPLIPNATGSRPSGQSCVAYCNSGPSSAQWMTTAICCKTVTAPPSVPSPILTFDSKSIGPSTVTRIEIPTCTPAGMQPGDSCPVGAGSSSQEIGETSFTAIGQHLTLQASARLAALGTDRSAIIQLKLQTNGVDVIPPKEILFLHSNDLGQSMGASVGESLDLTLVPNQSYTLKFALISKDGGGSHAFRNTNPSQVTRPHATLMSPINVILIQRI